MSKEYFWTEEKISNKFIELQNKFGYVPMRDYFNGKSSCDMPSRRDLRRFGEYGYFISKNNLLSEEMYKKQVKTAWGINNALDEISILYEKLGRLPYVKEFEEMSKSGLARRNLEENLGMSWNNILIKYFGKKEFLIKTITYDLIKDTILNIKKHKDRVLLKDVANSLNVDSTTIIAILNGIPFCDVLEDCGLNINKKSNIPKDKNDMLKEVLDFYNENSRLPICDEISQYFSFSYGTMVRFFGSLENMCKELNIKPNRKQHGYGTILYDKKDELCRSTKEQIISNFLIDNNIYYKKELTYKEIYGVNETYRCDWFIKCNNKSYIVEYFGVDNETYHKKTKTKTDIIMENTHIATPIIIDMYNFKKKSDLYTIFKDILKQVGD